MKNIIRTSLLATLLLAFAGCAWAQLASSTWPKFHRDYASTGVGQYGGTSSELSWTFQAGGAIRSAPVYGADGTVYFTCTDGKLYAVLNGVSQWSYACNCDSTAAPAVGSDGAIYVAATDNCLYAIRSTGTLKWKKQLGSRPNTSIAMGRDGSVYAGCVSGLFYAYSSDGMLKWTYTAGGAISSSPAIGTDGSIYFGCQDSKVYALTSAGALKWKFAPASSGAFYASPAIGGDGTIYIGSAGSFFYAINPNGTQKWRANAGGDVRSSAAVNSNGNVYYGCRDGKIHALTSLGQGVWTVATGQYVDASPAIGSDGGVFAASLSGKIYALNPDGGLRWVYDTGSAIYSSPALGPGSALAIGADNGKLYCFASDSTPPDAPTVTDDGAYTAQTDRIHGSWSAIDSESGIFSYEYCIGTAPGLADVAPWLNVGSATQATRTGLTLIDKKTYYITARAINGAGVTGPTASSDGITVDATPPSLPIVTDDGAYTADNTKLHASWSASDPESGIGRYEYSIGTTPGAVNIAAWTDAGAATSVTRTGLNLQQGVTYYINVRSYNTLGVVGATGSSDGILVDTAAPPAPIVTDDGAFTATLNTLHAAWTAVTCISGIAAYEYSIGTSAGATNIKTWTDVGLNTSVTNSSLALTNGATYFINVRARSALGKEGVVGSADGITVDTTPPTVPVVTDDGSFTSSTKILAASWTSNDPESGLTEYFYAVGTTAGGTDIRGWTSVGTSTSFVITSLSLTDGKTYYISVKAKNNAGTTSTAGTSDGIIVDATPPSTPVVTDDEKYTMDSSKLHATWSASDPQSGIFRYEYSIGTTPGGTDIVNWTDAGTGTSANITGLSLVSGLKYYINVRATNGARALSSVGSSDGIFVESTPPTTPVVIDDGDFTTDSARLHAVWSSDDPETGVAGYEYSIGTSAGATDLISWTSAGLSTEITKIGLDLKQGASYFVNVRVRNGVGMVSEVGSSDGILVDGTPPVASTVTDDGEYTSDNSQLHAVLECSDPESGIASYECAVGTTPGGSDIANWHDAGHGPDATITGLNLKDGVVYYISARATNGAGMVGPAGTSDGIKVDATPPVGLTVQDDGIYTGFADSMYGRWSAADPESGIAGYKYCIGTAPGLDDVASWLDAGSATEHTRTGLSLASGQTYYITVVAVNGARGVSAPVSSDGIKLDLTPPATPVVTDNGIYWGIKTSMPASWSSSDPESGIVSYRMSIGTAPGLTDVADWLEVGPVTSYTRTGLLLQDGVTYYINIQSKNGAGVWSATGSSDGIKLDSTPPTTPAVTDDGDGTLFTDRLHAKWHSEDPESGIAEYFYCIGTSPGAVDVVGWTSAGVKEEVTVTGLKLEPMLAYYFAVKACSGAGAWSAVSASDGIQYSTGAAIWWKFRNDISNVGRQQFSGTKVSDLAWSVPTNGYVESSPAIASDGTTYIGSGDGCLYAITQNGTLRWKFNAGAPIDSSPAVAVDGRLIFGCSNGKVYCLNPSGDVAWIYGTTGAVRSSPVIQSGRVYVGCNDTCLYAISLATGTKLWSYKTSGAVWSSPACDNNGVVYVASGDSYIYAINPDGTRKWRYLTGSATDASPAVGSDGTVYVGSGDGYFYAVKPDGTLKWKYDTKMVSDSSPAISSDGNIYFGWGIDGGDGGFTALRPDGTKIWSLNLPLGGVVSSPALDSTGMIYVGSSNEYLYAISPNGTVLWKYKTGSSVASSPALGADSSVVFGSYDGSIYCLRDVKARDLTPPSTPVVTVPDNIAVGQPLIASWSATDPDSMVAEYVYAVGTAPGGTDVVYWTSAGIGTKVSLDGLQLAPGCVYYVSVKARNSSQRWSDIGVSKGISVTSAPVVNRIGQIKKLADQTAVSLYGKVVSSVFDDCFYVQESDRAAGICCVHAGAKLAPGDVVNLIASLTTSNGSRVLTSVTYTKTGSGPAPRPLGVCAKKKSAGLDTDGIRVKIWGKVKEIGTDYCAIDGWPLGIKIRNSSTVVSKGDFIVADGILCREKNGDQITSALKVGATGAVTIRR